MKIHHIGYLVQDKAATMRAFEALGYHKNENSGGWIHDLSRKIEIAFVENHGILVELVHPDDDCTLIGKALRKLRSTPYHICYACNDLDDCIAALQEAGWIVSQAPAEAPALGGRRVAFLYGKGTGLIELLEMEES